MDSEKKPQTVELSKMFSEEDVAFDFYSCEEAIIRLNDYLDHELNTAERADVVKHLQICKPCLERFHFEETLITQIRVKVAGFIAPKSLRERLGSIMKGNANPPSQQ
jgi:mycothiol system anti-sigma-R factor